MFKTLTSLSLDNLKTDIPAVLDLEGNCGRTVRRTLERLFPNGTATITLQLEHAQPIQFGYRCYKLMEIARYAEEVVVYPGDPTQLVTCKVQNINAASFTLDLVIHLESIPENVKGRQTLLGLVYEGVYQFWHHVAHRENLSVDTVLAIALGFDDADESNEQARATGQGQFDKLLAGDFSELEKTPGFLLEWAKMLKPEVAAAEEAWEDEQIRAENRAYFIGMRQEQDARNGRGDFVFS